MDILIQNFIEYLNTFSVEILTIIEIFFCIASIIFFFYYFDLIGIATCASVMLILANIQILKLTHFNIIDHNFALGTVAFSSTYLISDIATEYYGKNTAIKIATISLLMQIFFIFLIILTMGYKPFEQNVQNSMQFIFVPQIRILIAGLFSYFITQIIDIYCFSWISNLTKKKMIWARVNISNFISQFCDSAIFNILCWKVFSTQYISIKDILFSYIMITFIPRFFVGILTTPVLYLINIIKK